METITLQTQEVLQGYDAVSELYPYIPSLSHWRSWEYAAYQKYTLTGRVLDIGCGDGRYFKLLWPDVDQVIGVDINPAAVSQAEQEGTYHTIHLAHAHQIPEPDASFDHVFANCSLEHMDHLDSVLAEAHRCLKPGGTLLCSVVTHRFIDWALLPNIVAMTGSQETADLLRKDFLSYHHLANPLTPEDWEAGFIKANLIPEEHIPIVPKYNSIAFLLTDSCWHLKQVQGGEMGDSVFPLLAENANFPQAFRTIMTGLLQMETDWYDCSGAIFFVRKCHE